MKIKTEVLDEIENFSANDELHIDVPHRAERGPKVAQNPQNQGLSYVYEKYRKRSSFSLVKREITLEEYVDFEEYIAALVTGKRLICSVCRIEFPDEAEFKTHMVGHSHGKLFQCGLCAKQFSR